MCVRLPSLFLTGEESMLVKLKLVCDLSLSLLKENDLSVVRSHAVNTKPEPLLPQYYC